MDKSDIQKLQAAWEAVYTGRLRRVDGFAEVPTDVFVEKVDVSMAPVPMVALFSEPREDAPLKPAGEPYSPLALSVRPSVWVREEDLPGLKSHAEARILNPSGSGNGSVNDSSALPPEKRMEILRRSAIAIVDDLFENPSRENIQKSSKVVGSFVYVLMRDPKAYLLLSRLSSHDPYTLQHSVGTSVASIILARKMGITDPGELQEAGLAGLLHDIGKVKVKVEIINKNGPLDELEWEEMRTHPQAGFEIVAPNPDLTERTKRAILEHHEDRLGTGYPHGRKHDQVDIFSRIVCLCDVFNALTTNRSYSKARTPFDAFQFMRDKLGHKIDEELFRQLVLVYGGQLPDKKEAA